jgi:hypothetical protein
MSRSRLLLLRSPSSLTSGLLFLSSFPSHSSSLLISSRTFPLLSCSCFSPFVRSFSSFRNRNFNQGGNRNRREESELEAEADEDDEQVAEGREDDEDDYDYEEVELDPSEAFEFFHSQEYREHAKLELRLHAAEENGRNLNAQERSAPETEEETKEINSYLEGLLQSLAAGTAVGSLHRASLVSDAKLASIDVNLDRLIEEAKQALQSQTLNEEDEEGHSTALEQLSAAKEMEELKQEMRPDMEADEEEGDKEEILAQKDEKEVLTENTEEVALMDDEQTADEELEEEVDEEEEEERSLKEELELIKQEVHQEFQSVKEDPTDVQQFMEKKYEELAELLKQAKENKEIDQESAKQFSDLFQSNIENFQLMNSNKQKEEEFVSAFLKDRDEVASGKLSQEEFSMKYPPISIDSLLECLPQEIQKELTKKFKEKYGVSDLKDALNVLKEEEILEENEAEQEDEIIKQINMEELENERSDTEEALDRLMNGEDLDGHHISSIRSIMDQEELELLADSSSLVKFEGDLLLEEIQQKNEKLIHAVSDVELGTDEFIPPQINKLTGEFAYPFIPVLRSQAEASRTSELHLHLHFERINSTMQFLIDEKIRHKLFIQRQPKNLFGVEFPNLKPPKRPQLSFDENGKLLFRSPFNSPSYMSPDHPLSPKNISLSRLWLTRILNLITHELNQNAVLSQWEKEKLLKFAIKACRRAFDKMCKDKMNGFYRILPGPVEYPNNAPKAVKKAKAKENLARIHRLQATARTVRVQTERNSGLPGSSPQ